MFVPQLRRYRVAAVGAKQIDADEKDLLIGWEGKAGFRAARVVAHPAFAILYCSTEALTSIGLDEGTEVGAIPFL